ncbi:unnamed protein product [Oikopleura dioica]|uniref:BTB domain-containing protein n=1 Tax=Oikopleura dioica TaxID=34765 RepID=E4YK74_OIKDI|nr:unnamed protein product [Oikopleura dioica]
MTDSFKRKMNFCPICHKETEKVLHIGFFFSWKQLFDKRATSFRMSKERTGPVDREHTANVMKSLHALRSQDIATDVTLHCKDGEFRAHSVVLLTSPIAEKVKARNSEIVDLSYG